jgi:hypothetical protein
LAYRPKRSFPRCIEGGEPEPPESRDNWPTYENMIAAFGRLIQMVWPGDQVYVHCTGHSGRTPTRLPKLKGPDGLDETLVPTDIGNSTARYPPRHRVRAPGGLGVVDTTPRRPESLVAEDDALTDAWRTFTAAGMLRGLALRSG